MIANEVKRLRAARSLAAGSTKAAAARAAEVDPGTITKWLQDVRFADMILVAKNPPADDDIATQAVQGLSDMVPKALKVIDEALDGNGTPQQLKAALDVVKAAKQLEPVGSGETGPSTLAAAIAEIDGSQPAR
jgi:hypothetical protein